MSEDRRLSVAISRVLIACVKAVSTLGALQKWLAVIAVLLLVLITIGSFKFRRIDISITIYENVHIEDPKAHDKYGVVASWVHEFDFGIPLPGSSVNNEEDAKNHPLIKSGVITTIPFYPPR